MIDVEIDDEGWTLNLPGVEALATAAAQAALSGAAASGDLVILLTDDATIRDLNARFRSKDQPTNVLSFPTPADAPAGPQGRRHLGDVALALGVCRAEAQAQDKPLAHHLQHLVAHGVLHLVGYDHLNDGEAEIMEALERRVLSNLDVPDPYAPRTGADAGHE